jgi:predicted Zn finger-like uncharacterized protein
MKIVCDNCATKYSIADEKVRGKVFKIRCKKCSHIIVVRGNEGGAAASAPDAAGDGFPGDEPPTTVAPGGVQGAAAGSDSVWHLVVDREQVGPLTAAEVRQKFAAGEIDVETYGWREGFADWLRLGSIDDFRDLGGAQAEPEGATRRTDSADLFSNNNSHEDGAADAGADLFGGAAAQAASAPAPAAADAFGGGGGLFGAPEQAAPAPRAARTSSPGFTPAAQPASMAMGGGEAVSDGGKMTGQRNENSVLFSLNNLQALASGGGGGAAAPKPGVDNRPGFANSQTEGSGLIDIRAMAASTLAASPTSSARGGGDEPEIAAAPIFSPMAAPILMPAAPSGPPKWIWAVLGVGVLAVLGIVVVGVLLLTKKTEPTVVAAAPTVAAPGAAAAAPAAAAPAAAPAAAEKAATPDKPAAEAKGTAPDKEDKGSKSSSKSSGKHEPKAAAAPKPEKAHEAAAPAPEAAPTPAPAKKGGKRDELDDLLNGASPDKPAAKPKAAAHEESAGGGDDSLPDQLEKGQIVGGMSKVKGKVAACYDQFKVPGMASVNVTIQKSGSVSNATVGGAFAGTPTGSCVEKAVKSASFPKFKGSAMSLTYPFMLR